MTTPSEEADSGNAGLREATLRGVKWITVGRIAAELSALASTVVLAHLLTPAELGRAAIGMIGAAVALAVLTQGIASAIVQLRAIDRRHLEVAGFISVGLGLALTVLVAAGAPLLLAPLVGSHTAYLVALSAPVFLLSGLSAVPYGILQRKLDFRTISIAESAGAAAGAIVAVGLAAAGGDGSAVLLGAVAFQGVVTAIMIAVTRPPRPRWRRDAAHEVAGFGALTAAGSLAYVAYRNVSFVIVGARLGAANLGYFWRGYQLAIEYQGKISGIMLRIAFPLYSRAGTLENMRRVRARVVRVHAVALLPPLALLVVIAPVLVPWLYGPQWGPAVLPTQILAGAGMVAVLITGMGPLLLAAGRPNAVLWWNVGTGVIIGVVTYLTSPHGVTAVCVGVVGANLASLIVAHWLMLGRIVGIPMRQVIADVAPGVAAALAVVAASWPVIRLLDETGAAAPLQLAAAGLVAVPAWVGALRLASPTAWADLALLVRRVLPSRMSGSSVRRRRVRGEATGDPLAAPVGGAADVSAGRVEGAPHTGVAGP